MAEVPLYRGGDFRRALDVQPSQGPSHEPGWRSGFWRDRARLVHSAAFRRLQGKTQLFAGLESDFFRNRLTHSLEVAQIAKSICRRLNSAQTDSELLIDEDLVEFAGLAHDLGHPPFGHTGEEVLDAKMRGAGGFEGNAQTLRILCRLEKKLDNVHAQIGDQGPIWYRGGQDVAVGLNLCSRTLASIIKYDERIPFQRGKSDKLRKGYYRSEAPVVAAIKHDVGVDPRTKLYLVECQIMDLADDIAYSTYDLEDAFKGGLLTPLDVLYPDNLTTEEVADRAQAELGRKVDGRDVREVLRTVLSLDAPSEVPLKDWHDWLFTEVGQAYVVAKNTASLGFYRTHLTSFLVNRFIQAVDLQLDSKRPARSIVTMRPRERLEMSILKQLTYVLLINSPRLRLVAHRGETVVRTIFDALIEPKRGARLLPPDYYQRYHQATPGQQPRVVCDFIAGMTDRYASEFYARLTSDVVTTMFKPL